MVLVKAVEQLSAFIISPCIIISFHFVFVAF